MSALDDELNMLLDRGRKAVKLALKLGADEADVYFARDVTTAIEIENGSVNFSEQSTDNGIGLRVLKDGHIGFSYCTSDEEIEKTLKSALSVTKYSRNIKFTLPEPPEHGSIKAIEGIFDGRILDLEAQAGLDMARTIMDAASEVHDDIHISGGGIGFGHDMTAIVNSKGLELGYYGTGMSASLSTVMQTDSDDVSGQGFEYFGSCNFDLDLEKIGRTASELAIKTLNPKSIDGGEMTVVFHPFAFAGLLEFIVLPSLYGEPAHKGESVYSNKLNEKVCVEDISLVDDATAPKGISSSPIDDEGLPSRKNVLIDRGILKGYLYDLASAAEFGAEPTGSGLRAERYDTNSDYHSMPDTSARNIFLEADKSSLEELISDIKDGIYIYSIMGAHTSNAASGDFSVNSPTLFKIDNGEIGGPCKPVMISGNFPALMHNIVGLGDDIRMVSGEFNPATINIGSVKMEKVRVTT